MNDEKDGTNPAVKVPREAQCKQARPHDELIREILNPRNMKTEREHAAAREIDKLREESAKLRAFAQDVLTTFQNGISDCDLQKLAEKHGLLSYEIRYEPCGEGCLCDEYFAPSEWNRGARCYRKTALLTVDKP
jgi:hypothetical protein